MFKAKVAILALASLALTTPAYALSSGVSQHVTTNDPKGTATAQKRIVNEMDSFVSKAPKGAKVRIVTWKWELPASTKVAGAAVKRGVDWKAAIAGNNGEVPEVKKLRSAVGKSRLTICSGRGVSSGACIAGIKKGGSAHNKLFTVSQSGNKKWVIGVTSSNVSNGQVVGSYNDLLVSSGDKDCYTKVTKYIDDSIAQRKDMNYAAKKGHFTCAASELEFWLGPRADKNGGTKKDASTDQVNLLLAKVKGKKGCAVRVSNSKIDDQRTAVAKQLVRIKKEGGRVQVLTRVDGRQVRDIFAKGGIVPKTGKPHVHTKSFSVVGCGGVKNFVTGGSGNLTGDHQINDESLYKSTNRSLVNAHVSWFNMVWNRA